MRRVVFFTIAIVSVLTSFARAQDEAPEHPLATKAKALIRAEQFVDALATAEENLARVQSDPTSPRFTLVDAQHLVSTIRSIILLSESAQKEVAEAEQLYDSMMTHFAEGRYAESLNEARTRVKVYEKYFGANHREYAQCLNDYAAFLHLSGDMAGAEPLYRESLVKLRVAIGVDHPLIANSLNNLAYLLYLQGDYVGAEPLAEEALAMFRETIGDEATAIAFCLDSVARIRAAQDNYVGAEPFAREALAMNRKLLGNEHPRVAITLDGLAPLLEAQHDYAGAEAVYRESLAMRTKLLGREHPEVAASLRLLGPFLQRHGDSAEAEAILKEALAIDRAAFGDQHHTVAETLQNLASIYASRGDFAKAEPLLTQAVLAYDAARLRVGAGMTRAMFQESPYPRLAVARLNLDNKRDAWQPAEQSLGQALGDLLFAADERALTKEEVVQETHLNHDLDAAERALAALKQQQGHASALDEARDQLLAAQSAWASFQREISQKYPVSEGRAFALGRVQKSLEQNEAILGWVDVNWKPDTTESWMYIVRSSGPVKWSRLPHDSNDIQHRFRDAVQSPGFLTVRPVETAARALAAARIAPLYGALNGVDNLIVISSGPMLGVPIEALIDETGQLLGDRFIISYVPSATIFTWLHEKQADTKGRTRRALLVGDPPFREEHRVAMNVDRFESHETAALELASVRSALAGNREALSSLPRLPMTRAEVTAISEMTDDALVLVGVDASEQNLRRLAEQNDLSQFDVIHIATHGLIDSRSPERSALVLSLVDLPDPVAAVADGAPVYTGVITAEDIVRGWKLNADIVTLSACETGLGKEVSGEGYVGFMHAFLQAGARSLLVSLWKVDDEATSLLMQRFYRNTLVREMKKAEALQEAKTWLRSYKNSRGDTPYTRPAFWSAFILVGDRG